MYVQIPPTVDAIQWTGSNRDEFEATLLAEANTGPNYFTGVVLMLDSTLHFGFKYNMSFDVPLNHYAVTSAAWGNEPRMYWAPSPTILSPEQFAARYNLA